MDKRFPLIILSFFLTIVFAIFHFVASAHDMYWYYRWTDVIMHFFAGVCGGLATYSVLFDSGLWKLSGREYPNFSNRLVIVFVLVMIVGVAWEYFEYANGLTDVPGSYTTDTVIDLILDGLGVVSALLIAKQILKFS